MPEMSAFDRQRGARAVGLFNQTTPVQVESDTPCAAARGDGGPPCGATPTRFYVCGPRCLECSPAARAGRTVPTPDPTRTLEALRAAAEAARPAPARAPDPARRAHPSPAARAKTPGPRDGETFEAPMDADRLNAQARRVWRFMETGGWHTLAAISEGTEGTPEASVSARLRDFRKPEFGSHTVERRRADHGGYEYRLLVPVAAGGR